MIMTCLKSELTVAVISYYPLTLHSTAFARREHRQEESDKMFLDRLAKPLCFKVSYFCNANIFMTVIQFAEVILKLTHANLLTVPFCKTEHTSGMDLNKTG